MTTNTAGSNKSHDSSIAQSIDSLVDTVTDALDSAGADLDTINAVEEHGDQVAEAADDEIEELRAQTEINAEQIEDNQDELQNHREHVGKQTAELNQRVATVEDEIDDLEATDGRAADTCDSNPQGVDDETTALERVCALPEQVVDDNLTKNQQRARSVARRIEEYGRKVPAGVAITSSRIKRILTAQEDTTIHRQTVSRVADFLERFGDGSVQIKETRGGKTTVVFDEEIVESVTSVVTEDQSASVTKAVV